MTLIKILFEFIMFFTLPFYALLVVKPNLQHFLPYFFLQSLITLNTDLFECVLAMLFISFSLYIAHPF